MSAAALKTRRPRTRAVRTPAVALKPLSRRRPTRASGTFPRRGGAILLGVPQRSSQTSSHGANAPHTVSGGSMTARCDTVT